MKDTIATATAVLKPLSGELGNGFAEVQIFTDESMHCSIRTNLPPLEQGQYVAWLRGDLLPEPLRIGVLRNPKGNTTYLLQGEENIQLPPLGNTKREWELSISHEPHDPSRGTSKPILEGKFTVEPPR